jgi:circadian clock protein KaiC
MGEQGITVLPITTAGLTHAAPTERVSTGIPELDKMVNGGFYRASSILVSGTAGTGKSSLAISFLKAACERGEKALYCSFEESYAQVARNMRSIGIDLQPYVDKGLFHFYSVRPSSLGIEAHLAQIHKVIKDVNPSVVAIDPITNFISQTDSAGVKSMLTRLVDYLKMRGITAIFTNLSSVSRELEATQEAVSSVMDAWLLLRDVEHEGRRSCALYVLKSRGMAHSKVMREFRLTGDGIHLGEIYTKNLDANDRQSAKEREEADVAFSSKGGKP